MTQLSSAVDSLWRGLVAVGGVAIIYTQDGVPLAITAVPGASSAESDYGDGQIFSDRAVDFIVNIADMGSFVPRIGDVIDWDGKIYEVLTLGVEREHRGVSSWRKLYRIHTKETA